MNNRSLSREGVWDGSQSRTVAPNASESLSRLPGLGLACLPTLRPISDRGQGVLETAATGHCFILPQEIFLRPQRGRPEGGNNDWSMRRKKSDPLIVATKPGNAGRVKGTTSC